MNIEILMSTMNQQKIKDLNLNNINTDLLIVNQSDCYTYEELITSSKTIRMYTFNERGIGKSRNNALMRAKGDICLLADDDMNFDKDYKKKISKAFLDNPKADIILFNVPSLNILRPTVKITRNEKVNIMNFMRYGAVNIAFRRESIFKQNISFSLLFGGGATYSAGEDSLFLYECLKKGLKVYANTSQIGQVEQKESTWFNGYDNKYFYDKGAFFAALSKKASILLFLQFLIRKHRIYKKNISLKTAYNEMNEGKKNYYKR